MTPASTPNTPNRSGSLLAALRDDPARGGLFLDFDGTLSEIVARPELAVPLPESPVELERLARRYAVVAVVSGRPSDTIRKLIDVPGLEVFGMYGLEEAPPPRGSLRDIRAALETVAAAVGGAWIEDKGTSLAVHYRQSPDPDEAERVLREGLEDLGRRHGLAVLPGKMVLELAPASTPGKGAVVLGEASRRGLAACLYAGDDVADLEAFAALDTLRTRGVGAVKVAVASTETPPELVGRADVVVQGPRGLLEVLRAL